MASSSSFQQRGERRGRWGSPERTVVWTEPKPKPRPTKPAARTKKVAVVYYLCHRDGHLDHPHFLELELDLLRPPHSAPAGLYLRDFTARLNALRGDGIPAMYSWSSRRSYRNGYVWQDLAADDLIPPAAHGGTADEYVLKGSPLLLPLSPAQPPPPPSAQRHQDNSRAAGGRHRRNWSSFDLGDRKLVRVAQQSATQTLMDHHRLDRDADDEHPVMELAIDEISPPPSSSSPDDTAPDPESCSREREVGVIAGGRMRASAVLMQIFSCGAVTAVKRGRGHARTRSDLAMASAASNRRAEEVNAYASAGFSASGGAGVVERDYFSGSLVESSSSKNRGGDDDALAVLKRSSSCNADRGAAKLKLPVPAKQVRAGCLASRGSRAPKKNVAAPSRKDGGECKGEGETADGAGCR